MAVKTRSAREINDEEKVKTFCEAFSRHGIKVRREKLTRGQAFRVRSGDCLLAGQPVVFVDRRLPVEQQLSVLADYAVDLRIDLDK